jgi:hypothetical protein
MIRCSFTRSENTMAGRPRVCAETRGVCRSWFRETRVRQALFLTISLMCLLPLPPAEHPRAKLTLTYSTLPFFPPPKTPTIIPYRASSSLSAKIIHPFPFISTYRVQAAGPRLINIHTACFPDRHEDAITIANKEQGLENSSDMHPGQSPTTWVLRTSPYPQPIPLPA